MNENTLKEPIIKSVSSPHNSRVSVCLLFTSSMSFIMLAVGQFMPRSHAARNRSRWFGCVLRKDENDWMKSCMYYEVEDFKPRSR